MKREMKHVCILIAATLLVVSFTAVFAADKPESYLVGLALPSTGSNAGFGIDFTSSFLAGVADVNKTGGIDGVPLKVVHEDTLGTGEGGVNAFNKLVRIHKAPVIVVSYSSVVKAMAALAVQGNVLVLNNGATSPDLSGMSPNLVNAYPLSTVDAGVFANYTYKKMGKRKAGIVYLNNPSGIGAARLYKQAFEKAGGKVVEYLPVEPETTDVSTQIAKLRAAKPDVIYLQLLPSEMIVTLKKIKEMGITAQLETYSAGQATEVRKAVREGVHGMIYSLTVFGTNTAIKNFETRFEKENKHFPSGLSYCVYEYDTAFLLRDAIRYMNKQGWEYNGLNVKKAILKIKTFKLPLTGTMVFDDIGDITKPVAIHRISDWNNPASDSLVDRIE